jgi:hypothetical protein
MFESTLATTQDADLVLKLYQLRTETVMRQARSWALGEFFPETADEVLGVLAAVGSQEFAWLRQVTTYWEMAAAFVLHGALNADLFLDCNTEPFFLYAKFQPLLPDIRKKNPNFLVKLEQVVEQYPQAQAQVDQMTRVMPERRAAALAARNRPHR